MMPPSQSRFFWRHKQKRMSSAKFVKRRFKKLKGEMKEISKEQESIKEGQRQVREKFKAIEDECDHLREETNQIIRQSANTQIRLGLMFSILKAREQSDFAKAAQLTQLLRQIVAEPERMAQIKTSSGPEKVPGSESSSIATDGEGLLQMDIVCSRRIDG